MIIIDLNKPTTYPNITLSIQSNRARIQLKKGYQGQVLIRNVSEKRQLEFLEFGQGSEAEVTVFAAYKNTGIFSTTIKQKKYGKSRYNFVSISRVKTEQKMNYIVDQDATLEVAILDFDLANKQAQYTCHLKNIGAQFHLHQAILTKNEVIKKIQVINHNHIALTKATMSNHGVASDQGNIQLEGIGQIDFNAKGAINQQQTHFLVLGEQAKATIRPLLYINENDVQAGHAMSAGKMDDETLFYLLSRGLSESEAKRYLVYGAFQSVIHKISDKKIQNKMLKYVQGVI